MRTMSTICVLAISLFLFFGCAARHYTLKNNEEIFGTWVSDKSNPQKLIMLPNATWEEYIYQSDVSPTYKGTYEATEKWKDSEGNIWYKQIVTSTFGLGKSGKSLELDKIDKSGNTWELVYTEIGRFDPNSFPRQIDKKDSSYRVYERAK
jgi:hypothetical protein